MFGVRQYTEDGLRRWCQTLVVDHGLTATMRFLHKSIVQFASHAVIELSYTNLTVTQVSSLYLKLLVKYHNTYSNIVKYFDTKLNVLTFLSSKQTAYVYFY